MLLYERFVSREPLLLGVFTTLAKVEAYIKSAAPQAKKIQSNLYEEIYKAGNESEVIIYAVEKTKLNKPIYESGPLDAAKNKSKRGNK